MAQGLLAETITCGQAFGGRREAVNLHSVANRAVGGFSMGGFGALKYTAKYYGHFASVSSHSGPASLRRDGGLVAHWANQSSKIDRQTLGILLFIAIYNDNGHNSSVWRRIKRTYNRMPERLRVPPGKNSEW